MSNFIKGPDLAALEAACKKALADAEALLAALRLEATLGAEIEFYLGGLDKCPALDKKAAAEQIKTLVRKNPYAFIHSVFTGMPMDGIILGEGETIEKLIIDQVDYRADRAVHGTDAAMATQLVLANIAFRAAEKNISLFAFHPELGMYCTADGLSAQQYEIASSVASASQTAENISQLNTIIAEEAQKLGLIAGLKSLPDFAFIQHEDGYVNLHASPNSRHIHFGARFADGTNAFDTEAKPTELSKATNKSAVDLLANGGLRLCNATANDMLRIKHRAGSVPIFLLAGNRSDKGAIAEADSSKGEPHKELRMAGAGTPPHVALLLPVLAIVDAALTLIGKNAKEASWLEKLLHGNELDHSVKSITASITDDDRSRLREAGLKPVDSIFYDSGRSADNLHLHKQDLSKLKIYVPEVAAALQQLSIRKT